MADNPIRWKNKAVGRGDRKVVKIREREKLNEKAEVHTCKLCSGGHGVVCLFLEAEAVDWAVRILSSAKA